MKKSGCFGATSVAAWCHRWQERAVNETTTPRGGVSLGKIILGVGCGVILAVVVILARVLDAGREGGA